MRTAPTRAAAVALTVGCAPVWGGPEYGFDWATIGDPGNAPGHRDAFGDFFDGEIGAVGYTYRMSRTEMTWGQYAEFIQAFRPHWTGDPRSFGFTGLPVFTTDDGQTYQVAPGYENVAAEPSWGMAARYANWLHNGKAGDAQAFSTGAYDTSDWVWSAGDPAVVLQGNFERSADARYWIPSEDEWVKAAYYDPNRNGEGRPGYWLHPNGSDEWTPADQTSSSMILNPPLPVGSFPDTQSPWGLLDLSGGASEWVGRWQGGAGISFFLARGSSEGDMLWIDDDSFHDFPLFSSPATNRHGLRLAASVPAPATALPFLAVFAWPRRR